MPKPIHHIEFVNTRDDIVRVVQLTDTHLCKAQGGKLLGMDTDHSLQAVIDLVQREHPEFDLLLGTGDLADGGARSAYDRLQGYFDQLTEANFWLPGNHDDLPGMQGAVNGAARLCKEVRAGNWTILLLDSQVPGQVAGFLGSDELALLESALESSQDEGQHVLVCLHHQPIPVGCRWLDEQMVADADAFFEVLDRYTRVRGVLWGHVHQEIDQLRNDVRLMASPSTCVQFAAGSDDFKAEDRPPGYRWLELHPGGEIETVVSRDRETTFKVELDSGGYL